MKRKLITLSAVAMVLVLTVSLSACGGGSDSSSGSDNSASYKAFAAAYEELNDSKQQSMNMDLQINMDIAGTESEMAIKGPVKVITGDSMQLESSLQTKMYGMDIEMNMWFKDGYMYIESMGQKMKQPMDEETALASSNASVTTFEEKYLKNTTKKSITGGTEYTFEVEGAALKALAGDTAGSSGIDLESDSIKWGDATVKVVLDKAGKIVSQEIVLSFEMEESDQTSKVDMTMKISDIKTSGVTIDYPADLDTYQATA
jgi:hypothetical protein